MNPSVSLLMPIESPFRERVTAVAIVAFIHMVIVYVWLIQPTSEVMMIGEMSVQITLQSDTVQATIKPVFKKPEPVLDESLEPVKPVKVEPEQDHSQTDITSQQATAKEVNPNTTDMLIVEPDYKAAYLNNARPSYPMVARRMGMQGKVILNVEVLDTGLCGQASIAQSSGYDVLDSSALQAVKTWRFVPARQAGQAVTKRFRVPIIFSLRDSAA